jgi:hypothetical protein
MGNLCVCECPDNLFKDNDMKLDKIRHYYSESNDEKDECKGLIKKQISRSKYGNSNKNLNSNPSNQAIPLYLTQSNESVTVLGENNFIVDSPKQSRKSSLSKLHKIIYY